MVRVTCSVASRKRRKKLQKLAKGYFGDRKNHVRVTKDAVLRAMSYNTIHRKQKKRDFRSLWIMRLAAATKIHGVSYSKFICGLKRSGSLLNRKVLAEMAVKDPQGFASVVQISQKGLAA